MNDKKNRQVFLVEGSCSSSVFQSRPLGRNYFEFDYFVWKLLYSVYEVPQKIACNAALELDQFLHSVKNSFSLSLIWCNTYLVKFLGSSKNLVEWFGLRTPMKHKELKIWHSSEIFGIFHWSHFVAVFETKFSVICISS